MAIATEPVRVSPRIGTLLARLRRRIYAYVWGHGIALSIAWLGLAFWITLALDRWIEPPVWVRVTLLSLAGIVLLYVVGRFILRRAFVRIADHNLAMLLERRFGQFHDSLLTTVELADRPASAESFNAEMLAETEHEAVRHLDEVRLGSIFRRGPLVRSITAAVLLVLSVVLFAAAESESFEIWVQRNVMFSDIRWPRRTKLFVEGFKNHRIKVAKGSDVAVVVKADTHGEVPDTVWIRYRTDETSATESMSRVGVARPEDEYQPFSFAFRGILSSRGFDVLGGDATERDFHIDVVDVPTIEMVLHCEFPAYTHKDPRDVPVTGLMQLPQGTKVTVRAKANKNLLDVPVHQLRGDKSQLLRTVDLAGSADPRQFSLVIDSLDEDQTLLFTLVDVDGIQSREPVRLILNAAPDEPPRVGVHLRGIGSSVTPLARLPIEGDISDDYGVAKLWFEYRVDTTEPVKVPFHAEPREQTLMKFDRTNEESLDIKSLNLTPGRQLTLGIVAQDNCTLKGGPNVAPGERYQLSIVTPEQLLSQLEARELMLRLRVEAIVQDTTETRDSLARLDFSPPGTRRDKPPAAATNKLRDKPAVKAADKGNPVRPDKLPEGAEPEDARSPGAAATPGGEPGDETVRRALASPQVVAEQSLANSERGASEISGVASAFDDIRDEMVNNRIDTPELQYRLKDQIADPLRRISDDMFPELDRRLRKLQGTLADESAGKLARDDAVHQTDLILAEMQAVLNKMLELESFNEVVEKLRDLIDEQAKLNGETQKQQKEQARKLND